ncbi:winged helix-turn-helix transcriptional regulator [Candidatus Woesearchaeota archaeon]|jgi:DNA-binding Lrp family transcriptional regulator|nr:winged helix-turn-helix transcriptional regulator [Candidatus Woesearchaeota archaeon]MBT3537660.1 winged helix-turn-helix transcriptional regulator [Candidatus Woesearchaeota archaeon]MBT4698094.1 winged helix-turn-helix transcriptional regulator [Candidatus Woesearchaeota archaeon]MBT4717198.1 winged helix-turn-helix transcriptional regulator [Candidatus Woesearchaeota archaeon]MBT7105329.1 winged helix-turn-helix transcriptional regulator [Candidatus Woesearchaeota archaeon]
MGKIVIEKKDIDILDILRINARSSLSDISRETNIPLSTVFDRVRRVESNLIKKYTSFIDFGNIGVRNKRGLIITGEMPELKSHSINKIMRLDEGRLFIELCHNSQNSVKEFDEEMKKSKCSILHDFEYEPIVEEKIIPSTLFNE